MSAARDNPAAQHPTEIAVAPCETADAVTHTLSPPAPAGSTSLLSHIVSEWVSERMGEWADGREGGVGERASERMSEEVSQLFHWQES